MFHKQIWVSWWGFRIVLYSVATAWRSMGNLLIHPSWATLSSFRFSHVGFELWNKPIHHFLMSTLYPMCSSWLIHSHWHWSPLSTHYSFTLLLSALFCPSPSTIIFLCSLFVLLHVLAMTFYYTTFYFVSIGISLVSYNNPCPPHCSTPLVYCFHLQNHHLFLFPTLSYPAIPPSPPLPSISPSAAHLCLVPCVTPRLPSPPVRRGTSSSSLTECWWSILKSSTACRLVHMCLKVNQNVFEDQSFIFILNNKLLTLQPSPSTSSLSSTHSAPPQMINSGPGSIRGELDTTKTKEVNSILDLRMYIKTVKGQNMLQSKHSAWVKSILYICLWIRKFNGTHFKVEH